MASVGEVIGIKLNLNGAAEFQVGLEKVSVELQNTQRQAQGASAGLRGMGAAADDAAEAQRRNLMAMRDSRVEANLLRQANRQLSMQMTDVVTSLASGMPAWMVLIQQGGQIKDSYGGVGAALQGVGGYLRSLINPLTAAGAALAAFAAAGYAGMRQAAELRDALILTGNATGVTAGQFQQLTESVARMSGQSVSGAREILMALVSAGRTSSQVIESQAQAIARIADLSGKAAKDIASAFSDQLDAPLKTAAKLNEQYNFLTMAEYNRIKALTESKRNAEAATLTNELLTKSLADQRNQMGYVERAIEGIAKAWGRVKEAVLSIGAPTDPIRDQIATLESELQAIRGRLADNQRMRRGDAEIPGLGTLNDAIRKQIRQAEERLRELYRALDVQNTNAEQRAEDARKTRQEINEDQKVTIDDGKKLLEQLQERNALMEEQLRLGRQLSDNERERIKFERDLAAGTLKPSPETLAAIQDALFTGGDLDTRKRNADDREKERKEREKMADDARKARARQLADLEREIETQTKANKTLREQVLQMVHGAEYLDRLKNTRLEDLAAQKESQAQALEMAGVRDGEAEGLRRIAQLLREEAQLHQRRADIDADKARLKVLEDERKERERNMAELARELEAGDKQLQSLRDEILATNENKAAVRDMTAARAEATAMLLEQHAAELEGVDLGNSEIAVMRQRASQLREEARLRRQLTSAIDSKAAREANEKMADDARKARARQLADLEREIETQTKANKTLEEQIVQMVHGAEYLERIKNKRLEDLAAQKEAQAQALEMAGVRDGEAEGLRRIAQLLREEAQLHQRRADIDADKARLKVLEDERKERERNMAELARELEAGDKQLQSLRDEILANNENKGAVRDMTAARAEATAALLDQHAAELEGVDLGNSEIAVMRQRAAQLREEARLRRELTSAIDNKAAREANEKAAQKALDEWNKITDQISQSLADALMSGGVKAGEAIKRYFSTLILQPIIRAVVDPIARSVLGMLGMGTASVGAAAQSAGVAAGGTGAGSGLFSMLGLSSAKLGVYGELFKSAGGLAMSSWGGSLQALGHAINAPLGQGLAMGAGTIAGTLGPIAIGQMLGRGISGGYSALGGRSGSTAVNLGTAIGAIGGPVGMAIGAIVGGIVNRAFGRKLTEQGITGTFGGEAGFSGNAYTFERGGWFRSDRTRTSALDPVMGGMLGQAYGALRTSTQAMADVLGQSGEAVRKFSADVRINLRGLSDQQVTQRLQEEMGKLAESLADAALGTREYTRLGETQAQALTRLSGSLSAVNAALDLLNRTTLTASLQSADLASQLSDLFGGDQGLSSAVAAFQQAFYTEAERTAIATRQVTAEMAKLHLALPETRAQFRAIVEAQDLNTEAGRKMFAALLQIAPAFDRVTASIDTVAGRLGTLAAQLVTEAQTAIQQQITASQAAANAARQAAEAYRGAGLTLLDTARALRGQAAPGASAAAAYRAGLAAAQGGDVTAMQGLSGLAQSYAESLRGSASSRAQYLAGTRSIAAELEAVAGTAGGLATQRSVQAALLDVNTAVLQTLAEDLQNGNLTVELLQEHSRSLASIAGALGNTGPVVQRLTGVDEGTSGVVEAQQLAGDLLASSDLTLARVLAKLGEPDANAAALAERVQSGNQLIADRLSSVIAAIGAQTAAQQAEIKRQQDLVKAQKDLESAASYLGTLQGSLSQAQATLAGTSPTMSVRVGTRYDSFGFAKGGRYEERSNPAYQTAVDAVNAAQQALAVYAPQVDQLRNLIRSLGGVPQFALGGLHSGGLRLVGERGPELEATGPARYWSAADTTAMLGNSQRRDEALVAEIRALREQVARLEAAQVQTAVNTGKTQRLMQRVTRDGESMQVTDVTPAP